MVANPVAQKVTGAIIAGGKSTRMGGNDKALMPLRGKPMIEWVIERLRPQVDALLINSNNAAREFKPFGLPVIADIIKGHVGPLAGLHACMTQAKTPLLACVPCDAPLLPSDLIARLHAALVETNADVAVAKTASSLQPAFFVCRNGLSRSIESHLAEGGYALRHWMAQQHCVELLFNDEEAFSNINSPQELGAFNAHFSD